tara:strand:+ start:141 stop:464 length:324 start_codon:yes stop_codon:yes gene_type:complete
MKLVLIFIFLLISFTSHGYHENDTSFDEEEIICIATYELAEDFFLQMKDPNTSEEMNKRKQALLNKYDEGHFPQEEIDFYILEIHYAWTANFDFLPPILKNCRENIS